MTKFHVTKKGKAQPCTATERPCPLGGEHYDSMRDAAVAAARHPAAGRMQRPASMTDEQWEDFEEWLEEDGVSRAEYESYLAETDSTLEREWNGTNHSNAYYPDTRQLVLAVSEHEDEKWKRSIASPLADKLLSRYLNPLQASVHTEELSARLIAIHDEAPNGILHTLVATDDLADEVMEWNRVEHAVKAFMFDKLWGGEAS